jgi:hypothetical protein
MATLTLQDMVDAVLAQAGPMSKTKIAQEASGGACVLCGKPAIAGSNICKECAERIASREGNERDSSANSGTEKTSSERIQKLASAVSYIVDNFNSIGRPVGSVIGPTKLGQAATQANQNVGPGKGPNVVQTNVGSPVPGEQAPVRNLSRTNIPLTPPMDSGATPKGPENAMKDNRDDNQAAYPETGVLKQSSLRESLRKAAMKKFAETTTPKQNLTLPEDQPSQMARPAEVTSQESMIGSNEAAMNYTKTQAKAVPKKRMGEVLDEKAPDIKQELNPVLGGVVKEAHKRRADAGRALLTKIAQEGCTCSDPEKGECRFCKVASRLKKTQEMRKKSQMGVATPAGPNPIGAGGVPPTVQPSSPIGGSAGSGTLPMM